MDAKRCTRCGEGKPATPEHFRRNKAERDGLTRECKVCLAAIHLEHKARNNARSKRWRDNNKDKIQKYETKKERRDSAQFYTRRLKAKNKGVIVTLTREEEKRCLQHWGRCAVCSNPEGVRPRLWVPAVLGGGFCVDNVVALCKFCATTKSNLHPEVWLTRRFGEYTASEVVTRVNAYFDGVR